MNDFSQTARWVSMNSDGARLFVGSSESGVKQPRLLLLHGNPATMDDWGPLAELLSRDFALLAPDLPGFGRSDDVVSPLGSTALDTAAECALAAAREVGWTSPFYVLGHSHGAGVAQVLAARYPGAIAGVVLLAGLAVPAHAAYRQLALPGMRAILGSLKPFLGRSASAPLVRGIMRGIMRPTFAPAILEDTVLEQQLLDFARRPSMLTQMVLLARENPSVQLARDADKIRAPVLFVHGAADQLIPIAHAQRLRALLANAPSVAFETVPHAGHMLHRTHASDVARLVRGWVVSLVH
jgi:pimeloyl-ACP methyl ester carboxylesterase